MGVRKPRKQAKPKARKPAPRASARKKRVIEAIVTGQPLARVAEEFRVARSTVTRDAQSSDVQQIVASLVSSHAIHIESLFDEALAAIANAFRADRFGLNRNGRKVSLGPDHYARLAAVQRLVKLATVGRPTPKAPEAPTERHGITLAEFEELYQRHLQATSGAHLNAKSSRSQEPGRTQ